MSNIENQSAEFAVNCNPGTPAKPPQDAGKRQAKEHVGAMLNRIQAAHLAGKRKRMKYLSELYLNSNDAGLVATELARRAMKPHRHLPKVLVPSIASGLDPWAGTTEEVRVNMIPKDPDSGDYRLTMDFGPENRALQYLLLPLLREIADLHPHQFGTGNGGPDLLPLPKEVTERVLLSRHLNLVPGNLLDLLGGMPGGVHEDGSPYGVPHTPYIGPACGLGILVAEVLAEARRGIPQGSAASPLLAEMLLVPTLKQLPAGGEVFAYLDNFLVMAKSKEDAVSMTIALVSALKAHPAGPLRPKIKGRFHPGEPIEFLGHRLTAHHGTVTIEPSPLNQQKFEVTMKMELARIKGNSFSPAARARKVRELKSYVRSWAAAFALWPQAEIHKEHWLAKIAYWS